MTDKEKEELKAMLEELPKEQLVQKLLELREENKTLAEGLTMSKARFRSLKTYFDSLYNDLHYFLSRTMQSRYERYFKTIPYLKILWRICSTKEEQGFCFSPAHRRFIRSVDAAVVAGKFAFEPGEEQDKEMMEQAFTNICKDIFGNQLENMEYHKAKADDLVNAES